MAKLEKIKFRKQFTDPESKRLESVYFGDMSPSDAARAKEYIERLISQNTKTPCFSASDELDNKALQSKYLRVDSNRRPTVWEIMGADCHSAAENFRN